MKLNLKILEDACTVSARLAQEGAERAFSALQMEEAEEHQLNSIVGELIAKAHFDARKLGFTDRTKGRMRRPTEPFDTDTPLDWNTSAKGFTRSDGFLEGLETLAQFVGQHMPNVPQGRQETILLQIQTAVFSLVRLIEEQGYEAGFSAVTT